MATVTADAQSVGRAIATTHVTWKEVFKRLKPYDKASTHVYGVPRGGMICAGFMAHAVPVIDPARSNLILDDVVDSGATMLRYRTQFPAVPYVNLYNKQGKDAGLGWIRFPWEEHDQPRDAVVRLIQHIGEDANREGLADTPDRVLRALREMTDGYMQNPEHILKARFESDTDELIVLRGIRFTSLCEHHMLPFVGTATVGYIPSEHVIGISKLARLVQCYARRLQIQERLTQQVAAALMKHAKPLGVGVVLTAKHSCMGCRGANQPDSDMITSAMLGVLRDKPEARAELMAVVVP